jgi:hypothetical protein
VARIEVLSLAALNRATLARQMLLARARITPARAIERLAGMQAQLARPPFVGLWTRIAGFKREALVRACDRREVVRATAMRGTLHLLSARDYLSLRASLQTGLTAAMRSTLRDRAKGLDLDKLGLAARRLLAEPLTFEDLRPLLAKAFPKLDERVLGYAVRTHVPLVQVPSATQPWGFPAAAAFALAEAWLGAKVAPSTPHALALRYLAAYGPATAADAQTWSGLSSLREVFDDLRGKLRTFADEQGRELFDLPRAPRPPASTPAPPRFLPEYDNLVLAFADRRRLVDDAHRPKLITKNLQIPATFLVDGRIAGTWKVTRKKLAATLELAPFGRLAAPVASELAVEGKQLLQFVEPDATRFDVAWMTR